jgi:hypothetical protein
MTQVDIFTFVILALASIRLTRLVTIDIIFEPIRERIWKKFPPHYGFGYLFTCSWCMGLWASASLVALYLVVPPVGYVVSLVLSISTIVGYIASRID